MQQAFTVITPFWPTRMSLRNPPSYPRPTHPSYTGACVAINAWRKIFKDQGTSVPFVGNLICVKRVTGKAPTDITPLSSTGDPRIVLPCIYPPRMIRTRKLPNDYPFTCESFVIRVIGKILWVVDTSVPFARALTCAPVAGHKASTEITHFGNILPLVHSLPCNQHVKVRLPNRQCDPSMAESVVMAVVCKVSKVLAMVVKSVTMSIFVSVAIPRESTPITDFCATKNPERSLSFLTRRIHPLLL